MTSLIVKMSYNSFVHKKRFLNLLAVSTILITCFGLVFILFAKPFSTQAVLNILETAYSSLLGVIIILSTPISIVATIILKVVMLIKYAESTEFETYYEDTVTYLIVRSFCLLYISAFVAIILAGFP